MTYFRVPLRDLDGNVRAHALVDGEDLDWVLAHRWFLHGGGGTESNPIVSYAARHFRYKHGRLGFYNIFMHRELLGLSVRDPRRVDHINRDRLDNRRDNLRVADAALNAQNKGSMPGSTSASRGVCWDSEKGRWLAQAKLAGRNYYLGRYDDELEAARIASEWRRLHMPGAVEEAA